MTPVLGVLVLGEMPSLPLMTVPPALPWRLGVMLSLRHLSQVGVPSTPIGHVPGVSAVVPFATVLRTPVYNCLWQFGHLAVPQSTFPLLPIPGKAPEALLHPAPSHKNTCYWGSQQFAGGSRQPPTRKHPPFLLAQVSGAGVFPLHNVPGTGWLCHLQRCSQGANLPHQHLLRC